MFFEIHRDLPREGPGLDRCTERALAALGPPGRRLLDVGCGPGKQTLAAARAWPDAELDAVDLYPQFLEQLRASAEAAGLAHRIRTHVADMRALPFAEGTFDAVLCEGAAYIMGVEAALRAWVPLLRPGGGVALTDAVWLGPSNAELDAFWTEYPQMTDVEGLCARVRAAGLELLDCFVLPPEAWWRDYYTPLEARLDALEATHAGDPELAAHRTEIDLYRRYPDRYGYAFAVGRLA